MKKAVNIFYGRYFSVRQRPRRFVSLRYASSYNSFHNPYNGDKNSGENDSSSSSKQKENSSFFMSSFVLSLVWLYQPSKASFLDEDFSQESDHVSVKKPVYRRSEIREHASKENGIWVTHGNGVYDITKFVVNHPGGQEKIILAAGGAVEAFWKIYRQHYNSDLALNALKPLLIGYLHTDDVALESAEQQLNSDDPYSSDPAVSPVQIFHQRKPINSESPSTLLSDTWVTPKEMWFNRNHHPVPHLNAEEYRLSIKGPGVKGDSIELTLDDLKTKFKKYKVTSLLMNFLLINLLLGMI
jgi:cytochrome b involved in lipid metabolism